MQTIDLDILHDKTLEAAMEFHRICQKYHLRYYMIGGTLLGAYREKDFIPWDDDMDMAMPRRDYDKLIFNLRKIKSDIIEIEYPQDDCFPWPYARIFHKNTTLIQGMFNYPGGVFIDLYPLDNAGSNSLQQTWYFLKFKLLRSILFLSEPRDRFQLQKRGLLYHIALLKGNLYWKRLIEKILRLQNRHKAKFLANYYGEYGKKEIMPASVFGTPELYTFRNTKLLGVANPDTYLRTLYGDDYMTPPPVSLRQNTRHTYKFIDFETPYSKYRKEGSI